MLSMCVFGGQNEGGGGLREQTQGRRVQPRTPSVVFVLGCLHLRDTVSLTNAGCQGLDSSSVKISVTNI